VFSRIATPSASRARPSHTTPPVLSRTIQWGRRGVADDRVYALDASSGALLWRWLTGENVRGSPAVVDGAVYVGSDDDSLYAFALPVEPVGASSGPAGPGLQGVDMLDPPGRNIAPSDSTGAIGPDRYVEVVNQRFGVYDRSGGLVAKGPLTKLAGLPNANLLDSMVIWDPDQDRFFYSMIDTNAGFTPVGWPSGSAKRAFQTSTGGAPTRMTSACTGRCFRTTRGWGIPANSS
jgi:putative pyrroloquinoline-quinone-binding quinoprotein